MRTTSLLLVGLHGLAYCASTLAINAGSEALAARSVPDSAFRTVYRFPNGHFAENLAVLSNGSLLVTIIGAPEVWLVDPTTSSAFVAYTFNGQEKSVLGITEYKPNVFAVAVGEFSTSQVTGKKGSWSVWSLDLSTASVKASLIAAIPAANFLNGLTSTVNGIILAADSAQGVIYRVDPTSKTSTVAFNDPALKPNTSATYQLGVNGIHVRGPRLYFDNSGQAPVFGWIPINADGTPSGAVQTIVATPNFPVNAAYHGFDDFAFDGSGNVWLATNPSRQIVKISLAGSVTVVAGSLQDSTLQFCTSLQFGRTAGDRNVLYVNCNGAGGKLLAVDMSGQV